MEARPTPSFNAFGWKKLFIQFLELRLVKLQAKEIVNSLTDEVGRRISMEERSWNVFVHTYTRTQSCTHIHTYAYAQKTLVQSDRKEGNNTGEGCVWRR